MTSPARAKTLATWLLAACTATALSTPAGAVVLCAREGGTVGVPNEGASVKVRSVCRDNEVTVDAGALGLSAGITTTIVRTGNQVETNGTLSSPARCEPGEVATGGGALSTGTNGGIPVIRSSRPEPDTAGATPTGWRTTVANLSDTGTITVTAYVVCAQTAP